MKKSFLLIFFVFFSFELSAFQRILSPVSGEWANRQCLLIDTSDGAECFYSLSGTDPLVSGFAYDGPMLIDLEGRVSLRVAVVKKDGTEIYKIDYTVLKSDKTESAEVSSFLEETVSKGIVQLGGAKKITVPKELSYSFWDESVFHDGTELSVGAENNFSRYVPCSVTNGKKNWRFVLYISGNEVGMLPEKKAPFTITDWTKIKFTSKNYVYRVDNGEPIQAGTEIEIDRSERHTVYWKKIDSAAGEITWKGSKKFDLPVKPSILVEDEKNIGKPAQFVFSGAEDLSGFTMKVSSTGLSGEIIKAKGGGEKYAFGTLPGEDISGNAEFKVYFEGVYQGNLKCAFRFDKKIPEKPKFVSNADGKYTREKVEVKIQGADGLETFFTVKGPFDANSDEKLSLDGTERFSSTRDFDSVRLSPRKNFPAKYKIYAYSCDEAMNKSSLAEYEITIDQYNYYFCENSKSGRSDGSKEFPFRDVSQVVAVLNSKKNLHFFVEGTVRLPSGTAVLSSDCTFSGGKNSKIVFPEDGFFTIRNSIVKIDGFIFEKENSKTKKTSGKMFVLENSDISFDNCEIIGDFFGAGSLFELKSSILSITNSGLTAQSSEYSCLISSSASSVSLVSSRFSLVSESALCFDIRGGDFELFDSRCNLFSHFGRIAEFSGAEVNLSGNRYFCDFFGKTAPELSWLFWIDDRSNLLLNENNSLQF